MIHAENHDTLTGWLYSILGTLLMWLQSHGLGLLGAASMCVGIYYQVKSDRRKERETEARIAHLARIGATTLS